MLLVPLQSVLRQAAVSSSVDLHIRQSTCMLSALLFWHAAIGVHIAKRRQQSPEWTILSHVDCFIQGDVCGYQTLLDSLQSSST